MDINLEDFRLEVSSINREEKKEPLTKRPHYTSFIRGPIDFLWVSKASALPGKSFLVGIAIWYVVGMAKSDTIKIQGHILDSLNISHKAFNRGLNRLAEVGLIKLNRKPGCSPEITLLNILQDSKEIQKAPKNQYWRRSSRLGLPKKGR